MKLFKYSGEGNEGEYTAIIIADNFNLAVKMLLSHPDFIATYSGEWGNNFLSKRGYTNWEDYLRKANKSWKKGHNYGTWTLLAEDISKRGVVDSEDRC